MNNRFMVIPKESLDNMEDKVLELQSLISKAFSSYEIEMIDDPPLTPPYRPLNLASKSNPDGDDRFF